MAQFTTGYLFGETEEVTPTKLNNMVDNASMTGLNVTNFAGGTAGVFVYGNTAPPLQRGILWYDTTAGAEGLKYAFVSPSNGSISKWLYLTPKREMICWTPSSASVGYPLYIADKFQTVFNTTATLARWRAEGYDGAIFPYIIYEGSPSLSSPAMVIPSENVSGSGPITCIYSGFAQCIFGNAPLTAGNRLQVHYEEGPSNTFRDNLGITVRGYTFGISNGLTPPPGQNAAAIIWGSPAYEKLVTG